MMGGRIALLDGLIHHQDIRRGAGRPRQVPHDRLNAALPLAVTAPAIPAKRMIHGLRMVATDLDWAQGTGPEVSGPGEALLMAMAGRRGTTAQLTEPGVRILTNRIERPNT